MLRPGSVKIGREEQDWVGKAARGAGAEDGCRAACRCWGPTVRRPGLQQSMLGKRPGFSSKRPGVTWQQQAQAGSGSAASGRACW